MLLGLELLLRRSLMGYVLLLFSLHRSNLTAVQALEKAATEDDVFKKFDKASKLGSSKSKAKRKHGQKAVENLRPITVDDIFAPIPSAEDDKKKGKKK